MTTQNATQPLDWYSLSRLNTEAPNIHQLYDILNPCDITRSLSQATLPYKTKLLLIFQRAQSSLQQAIETTAARARQEQAKKGILLQTIRNMQLELEQSYTRISELQLTVVEKKKLLFRFRAKVQKKNSPRKSKNEQYFCPYCSRDDFPSRELFTKHMFAEHNQQSKGAQSISHELKELFSTFKDKEIEFLSVMMREKNEFMNTQIQKQEPQRPAYRTMNLLPKTEFFDYQEQQCQKELSSSSQFVAFQHSEQLKREIQQGEDKKLEFARREREMRAQQAREIEQLQAYKRQTYKLQTQNDYYERYAQGPKHLKPDHLEHDHLEHDHLEHDHLEHDHLEPAPVVERVLLESKEIREYITQSRGKLQQKGTNVLYSVVNRITTKPSILNQPKMVDSNSHFFDTKLRPYEMESKQKGYSIKSSSSDFTNFASEGQPIYGQVELYGNVQEDAFSKPVEKKSYFHLANKVVPWAYRSPLQTNTQVPLQRQQVQVNNIANFEGQRVYGGSVQDQEITVAPAMKQFNQLSNFNQFNHFNQFNQHNQPSEPVDQQSQPNPSNKYIPPAIRFVHSPSNDRSDLINPSFFEKSEDRAFFDLSDSYDKKDPLQSSKSINLSDLHYNKIAKPKQINLNEKPSAIVEQESEIAQKQTTTYSKAVVTNGPQSNAPQYSYLQQFSREVEPFQYVEEDGRGERNRGLLNEFMRK